MELADRLHELGVEAADDGYVPPAPAELVELELRVGMPLPPDYVAFASTYGRCWVHAEIPALDGVPGGAFPLDQFLGGYRGEWVSSVLGMQAEYADRFPEGSFPIADNLLGDPFVLWVTDPEVPGSVFYAAYHGRTFTERRHSSDRSWKVPCYRVASSFSDLLDRAAAEDDGS